MNFRRATLAASVLVVAAVVGGCTSTTAGSALPAPGQPPAQPAADPNDPCRLLTPEQASALGVDAPPEFQKARPQQRLPPGCKWRPTDPEADTDDELGVLYSTDQSLEEYQGGGAEQPIETVQLGGLTWERYLNLIGETYCGLYVKLSANSFVEVSSENSDDKTKSCDLAKAAAPQVASHLPGGAPAPPLPSKPKAQPSPLAAVEPCDLLKPEQLAELKLAPAGRKTGKGRSGTDTPPGCEWEPAADTGFVLFYVSVMPDRSAEDASYGETSTEQVDAGGRQWALFPGAGGAEKHCAAVLAFGEKSSVKVTSGHDTDVAQRCDQLKEALPLLSASLPAA
ncbi:DUF3558 family protein [Amycolatopsis nigrescens]|uniref:DUF3558 family protein n=1 Tax=Amycolatopsis nigrescens TaxID=381445 RepID=UPI00037A7A2C|nr:DUF3558 family protein [Amycolatopsis nigrescens]